MTKSLKVASADQAAMKHKESKKVEFGFNPVNSDLSEDIVQEVQDFMKISNMNYCNSVECLKENNKTIQKLLSRLTENMSNGMNNQVNFWMKSLSCTTVVDFTNLFQQHFQDNLDNFMRLNEDLWSLINHNNIKNYQHTAECAKKI